LMKYVIFLRGINTGGMKLAMADFKTILQDAGCRNVTTIQAAGTAVFSLSPGLDATPGAEIGRRLAELLGKPVYATIRTQGEITAMVDDVSPLKSPDEYHDYVMLTDDRDLYQEISSLHASIPYLPGERLINRFGYFIWTIPKGQTLGEFGSKVLGAAKYRSRLTSRNFSTILKILLVMEDPGINQ
jgi:uncharacterized protein (DUF1697 family)